MAKIMVTLVLAEIRIIFSRGNEASVQTCQRRFSRSLIVANVKWSHDRERTSLIMGLVFLLMEYKIKSEVEQNFYSCASDKTSSRFRCVSMRTTDCLCSEQYREYVSSVLEVTQLHIYFISR